MKVRATVLCENSVSGFNGLLAESGWSVYLETEQGNYLFDTGLGKTIINNAQTLNKDLRAIKGIMLSHHHCDHTGGLLDVLGVKGDVDVFSHDQLFKQSYWLTEDGYPRYLGVPFNRQLLESKGGNFIFSNDYKEIAEDIFLTGEIPRMTSYEKGDSSQVVKDQGEFVQDTLLDDQSLIIKTDAGLFIILGCSHAGIINTLNYAIQKTGEERIHTVIGGTHLGLVSEEQRKKSIEALGKYDIKRLGVSHCTGFEVSKELAGEYGDRFFVCNVGSVVDMN